MSTITGDTEFNNSNNNGIVTGETSFSGDSANTGTIIGDAYFSDSSENNGVVDGNAAFYDGAVNSGEITEAAVFLDGAQNNGEIGEAMTAPQITEQPQTVKKLSGTGNAEFMISGEGAMLNCNWTDSSCGGPYGRYAEYRVITINDPGQGQSRVCDVLCKLENPAGQATGNLALCIFGVFPTVAIVGFPGDITVDKYANIAFSINGTSNDDSVSVALVNASNAAVIGNAAEITDIDGNYSRQNIVVASNIPYSANNTSVKLKVSDSFGVGYSSSFMLFVNDTRFNPQITQQPASVEAYAGQTVSFTVEANDGTPNMGVVTYRWIYTSGDGPGLPNGWYDRTIPSSWNPIGENTNTLTVTIPSDAPLGFYDPNNTGGYCFACLVSGDESPDDGTGRKIPIISSNACMTIVEAPE
jgi:hypothetical protein